MGKIIELQTYRGRIPHEKTSVPSREEMIIETYRSGEKRYIKVVNELFYRGESARKMRKALRGLETVLEQRNEGTTCALFDTRFPFQDGLAMRAQATLISDLQYSDQLSNKHLPFGVRVFLQERRNKLSDKIEDYRRQYSSEA